MALLNEVQMKLILQAEDQAGSTIETLTGLVQKLADAVAMLGKDDPITAIQDAADAASKAIQNLTEDADKAASSLVKVDEAFAPLVDAASSAGKEMQSALVDASDNAINASKTQLDRLAPLVNAAVEEAASKFSALPEAAKSAMNTAVEDMLQSLGKSQNGIADLLSNIDKRFGGLVAAAEEAAKSFLSIGDDAATAAKEASTLSDSLSTVGDKAAGIARVSDSAVVLAKDLSTAADRATTLGEMLKSIASEGIGTALLGGSGSGSAIETLMGGAGGSGGIASAFVKDLSDLPNKLMMMGMNAYMGMFALQGITNAAQIYSGVGQMMQANNQTSGEAAQAIAMLGAGGIQSNDATSYLRGVAGNLQTLFTPNINTGMLNKDAIILQSLGITQQSVSTSPWELMNTIGSRYRSLVASGQGDKASQLLQLTGTQQMASVFQNWSYLANQSKNMMPNMSYSQVNKQAQEGLTLSIAMEKMTIAFDQLAVKLAPLATKITDAMAGVFNALSGGKGLSGVIEALVKNLGGLGAAAAGAFAVLEGYKFFHRTIGSIFKTIMGTKIPLMNVSAGVVNVGGGGLPGGGGGVASEAGTAAEGAAAAESAAAADAAAGGAAIAGGDAGILGLGAMAGPIGIALAAAVTAAVLLANPKIRAALGKMLDEVVAWAEGLWGHVSASFGHFVDRLGAWAEGIWGNVASRFEGFSRGVSTWAGGLWGSVSSHFSGFTGEVVRWAATLWSGVSSHFSGFAGNVVHWAATLWSGVSSHFSGFTGGVVRWASTLWRDVEGHFSGFTSEVERWASGLWARAEHGTSSFLGQLDKWASGLWGSASTGFSSLATGIGTWASNLWSNVKSNFGSFTSGLRGWASGLWSYISSYLHGGSKPSSTSSSSSGSSSGRSLTPHPGGGVSSMGQTTQSSTTEASSPTYAPTQVIANAGSSWNAVLSKAKELVTHGYVSSSYQQAEANYMQYAAARAMGSSMQMFASGGVIGEPVAGVGLSSGQGYMFGEAGPEMVVPMSATRGKTSAAPVFNISVNIQGGAKTARQMAQEVANELVRQLNLRGNFDLSF